MALSYGKSDERERERERQIHYRLIITMCLRAFPQPFCALSPGFPPFLKKQPNPNSSTVKQPRERGRAALFISAAKRLAGTG